MPKRRQYTRELLTARARSIAAHEAGRGPLLRVVAGVNDDHSYPVEYAPRRKGDPRPWVQRDVRTGAEIWRHTGRECWAVAVSGERFEAETWGVGRAVRYRLAHLGVSLWEDREGGASWLGYRFADGSRLMVSARDVYGNETGVMHTYGEHGAFTWDVVDASAADSMPAECGSVPVGRDVPPDFGRDLWVLVRLVERLADERGRMEQERATEVDRNWARGWAHANGVDIAPAPFPV